MIGLMVVLLTISEDGDYGVSTVGVGVILGNGCEIKGQNYVTLLQGSDATVRFYYRSLILCI